MAYSAKITNENKEVVFQYQWVELPHLSSIHDVLDDNYDNLVVLFRRRIGIGITLYKMFSLCLVLHYNSRGTDSISLTEDGFTYFVSVV